MSRNANRTPASKMLTRMMVKMLKCRFLKASDCPNLYQASAFYVGQALTKNMGPDIGVANGSVGIVTSIVMEPCGEDGEGDSGECGSRVPLYFHVKFPGLTVKLADELKPGCSD